MVVSAGRGKGIMVEAFTRVPNY